MSDDLANDSLCDLADRIATREVSATEVTENAIRRAKHLQPALSVPCGFAGNHLPVGFQLIGRPFAEATLFRLGHAYQQATRWHLETPPDPAA